MDQGKGMNVRALGGKTRGWTIPALLTVALSLGSSGGLNFAQGQPVPVPEQSAEETMKPLVSPTMTRDNPAKPVEAPAKPLISPVKPVENTAKLSETAALNVTGLLVPGSVKQGNVLKVYITDPAKLTHSSGSLTAHFAGRKATFFSQKDGGSLALVPISVFEKPGTYPLSIEGADGKAAINPVKISVINANFKTQNVSVSKTTEGLQPLPGELEAIQALKDRVSSAKYWDNTFISPTPDCQNSPFGVLRLHNGVPTGDYHKGVDLRSPAGRPIRAINGGVVQIAQMYRLHGGTVGVDHGQGVSSIYIHMSKLNVTPGAHVKKGDVIGFVGSTGFATGPHLHWGMYVSGLPVNPNQWIVGVPRCQ